MYNLRETWDIYADSFMGVGYACVASFGIADEGAARALLLKLRTDHPGTRFWLRIPFSVAYERSLYAEAR